MKELYNFIIEKLTNTQHHYNIGNLIFDLDENSKSLLSKNFINILESNNYKIDLSMINEMGKYHKTDKNKRGNRKVWTSNDGDNLKIGDHATQRETRPIASGGDGEAINEREIINMFVYTWADIINLYNDGYLDERVYDISSFTTQCKSYLVESNDTVIYSCARPNNKQLWSAWMIKESIGYKIDIIIRTIFRGEWLGHSRKQERIFVDHKGNVKHILPKY